MHHSWGILERWLVMTLIGTKRNKCCRVFVALGLRFRASLKKKEQKQWTWEEEPTLGKTNEETDGRAHHEKMRDP